MSNSRRGSTPVRSNPIAPRKMPSYGPKLPPLDCCIPLEHPGFLPEHRNEVDARFQFLKSTLPAWFPELHIKEMVAAGLKREWALGIGGDQDDQLGFFGCHSGQYLANPETRQSQWAADLQDLQDAITQLGRKHDAPIICLFGKSDQNPGQDLSEHPPKMHILASRAIRQSKQAEVLMTIETFRQDMSTIFLAPFCKKWEMRHKVYDRERNRNRPTPEDQVLSFCSRFPLGAEERALPPNDDFSYWRGYQRYMCMVDSWDQPTNESYWIDESQLEEDESRTEDEGEQGTQTPLMPSRILDNPSSYTGLEVGIHTTSETRFAPSETSTPNRASEGGTTAETVLATSPPPSPTLAPRPRQSQPYIRTLQKMGFLQGEASNRTSSQHSGLSSWESIECNIRSLGSMRTSDDASMEPSGGRALSIDTVGSFSGMELSQVENESSTDSQKAMSPISHQSTLLSPLPQPHPLGTHQPQVFGPHYTSDDSRAPSPAPTRYSAVPSSPGFMMPDPLPRSGLPLTSFAGSPPLASGTARLVDEPVTCTESEAKDATYQCGVIMNSISDNGIINDTSKCAKDLSVALTELKLCDTYDPAELRQQKLTNLLSPGIKLLAQFSHLSIKGVVFLLALFHVHSDSLALGIRVRIISMACQIESQLAHFATTFILKELDDITNPLAQGLIAQTLDHHDATSQVSGPPGFPPGLSHFIRLFTLSDHAIGFLQALFIATVRRDSASHAGCLKAAFPISDELARFLIIQFNTERPGGWEPAIPRRELGRLGERM